MPELPDAKRERLVSPPARLPRELRYAELRCRTNYSFLEGASHPDELANRTAELGYAALAVTDRNSLAGVVHTHVAAKEACLRLLVGSELTPCDAPARRCWGNRPGRLRAAGAAATLGPAGGPEGGIPCEHAPEIRSRACARLCWLGIEIDEEANRRNDAVVSAPTSRVVVRVVPTNKKP